MGNLLERNILLQPKFEITIKGKLLGEDMLRYVEEVSVEDEEDMLPLARILVQDPDSVWVTDKNIVKDSAVTVSVGHIGGLTKKIFDGKITLVEASFPQSGDPTITISAVDVAVSLQKERKPRSWKKKKISDIISLMLKESGLKGSVEDTKIVLENIQQENETNLEFITHWRKTLGWRFFKQKSGTWYFGRKEKTTGSIVPLGYKTGGMEVISFQPTYVQLEVEDKGEDQEIENLHGKLEAKKLAKASNGLTGSQKVVGGGYGGGASPTGKASPN